MVLADLAGGYLAFVYIEVQIELSASALPQRLQLFGNSEQFTKLTIVEEAAAIHDVLITIGGWTVPPGTLGQPVHTDSMTDKLGGDIILG
jgi:hypothetical protein